MTTFRSTLYFPLFSLLCTRIMILCVCVCVCVCESLASIASVPLRRNGWWMIASVAHCYFCSVWHHTWHYFRCIIGNFLTTHHWCLFIFLIVFVVCELLASVSPSWGWWMIANYPRLSHSRCLLFLWYWCDIIRPSFPSLYWLFVGITVFVVSIKLLFYPTYGAY
jgi:hypothetical protein